MSKLRYGLIGSGAMGRGHIKSLALFDGAEIIAIADPHEPNRAQALEALGRDVPTYDGHREMLSAETLDAVVVATPNCTHAGLVCDALEAGCHALGEKPMATTVEDCNRIVETAARTGKVYQIGLELRHAAVWQRVVELVRAGEIGRVRQMWCKEFRGPWGFKVEDWITQQARSGGALVEKDCHHFDLFNWFADAKPVRVAGFGTCDLVYGLDRFARQPDVLDNAQVVVQYADGAVATLMLCMYCTGYREGLEIGIVGTEGWIVANQHGYNGTLELAHRATGETATITLELPESVGRTSHGGAVYFEHIAFADHVRHGTTPLTDARVAWWATVVPLAAERAVAESRIVEISEFGPPPE